MIERSVLEKYLNEYLRTGQYQDYGPNGLQIEGTDAIKKIAFAVSATKESIAKAVEINADALIVHHGLFWKFHGPKVITKAFYQRVAPLIKNNINLFGFHLPLDGHIEIGNAAAIAKKLNLMNIQSFGDYKGMPTGVLGEFPTPIDNDLLKEELSQILSHNIIHSKPGPEKIKNIGIITGGANSEWKECLNSNLDSYLTGEMSEHDWHEAKESGIHFYAGGHNATEQFGIQELLKHLHHKYNDKELDFFYIPSDNPA